MFLKHSTHDILCVFVQKLYRQYTMLCVCVCVFPVILTDIIKQMLHFIQIYQLVVADQYHMIVLSYSPGTQIQTTNAIPFNCRDNEKQQKCS